MSKPKAKQEYGELAGRPVFTPRFLIAIVLVVVGIAWVVYYYVAVRVDPTVIPAPEAGRPRVHGRPRRLELPDRLRPAAARPRHLGPPEHPARAGAAASWSACSAAS